MSANLYGWVAGLATLAAMLAFIGAVAFSLSARRRDGFAQAALLPLEEDAPPGESR